MCEVEAAKARERSARRFGACSAVRFCFAACRGGAVAQDCEQSLQEPAMNPTTIVLFLAFLGLGAGFGWVTFSHRHLFSEGPSRPGRPGDNDDTAAQRVIWVLSCSALWPLLAVTGMLSLWRLRRARVRHAQERREG
jgi:hypothetical protein